ncbi:hypothetical protein A2U01_0039225, partial [Trifolium medium]|nr:hypothetical protein [Trifolium medium]
PKMRMMDDVSKRDGDLVEGSLNGKQRRRWKQGENNNTAKTVTNDSKGSLNGEQRCRKENLTTRKFEGGSEIHGRKRKNKRCNEKMREEEEAIKW